MVARLAQSLVHLLTPLLGSSRAELVVARVYAVIYLVYYHRSAHYARSLLGLLWLILTPLLFLAVYVPVLTQVGLGDASNPYDYAFFIVAGFLPWNAFSEGFSQGAASIANSATIVRHAPIPPSLLPAISVCGAFMGLLVGVVILVPVLAVLGRFPGLRLLLLLPSLLLLYGFTLGISWATSSIAVFVRDVLQLLPTILLIEFFACPVVYRPSRVAGTLGMLVHWNPLTPFLAIFRAALAPTAEFAWLDLALAFAWTAGALLVGTVSFKRLESHFADAL
jgi:lipopolysaccharide transport system permease protein